MEDPKNVKDDKEEKESPELKEELSDEELKGVTGGIDPITMPEEDPMKGIFLETHWAVLRKS